MDCGNRAGRILAPMVRRWSSWGTVAAISPCTSAVPACVWQVHYMCSSQSVCLCCSPLQNFVEGEVGRVRDRLRQPCRLWHAPTAPTSDNSALAAGGTVAVIPSWSLQCFCNRCWVLHILSSGLAVNAATISCNYRLHSSSLPHQLYSTFTYICETYAKCIYLDSNCCIF